MKKIALLLVCCLLFPVSLTAQDTKDDKTVKEAKDSKEDKKAKEDKGDKKAKESKDSKEKVIALHYKPREKAKEKPGSLPQVKIYFEEIRDTRPQPKEIGVNQESKDKKIIIVAAEEGAAGKFVHSVLKNEFRDKGFLVEDNSTQAQKIIRGTLSKFWIVEERRYNSEILLKIEIRDKSGTNYLTKHYSGTGSNFGRSLSEANYQETLSDSLARMIEQMFADGEFLRALNEKPKPVKVEEKTTTPAIQDQSPAAGKTAPARSKPKKPAAGKPSGPVFGPK
ncbi:MAG: YajG family lipoprotein [Thermodesulfobacteriota bacterium]